MPSTVQSSASATVALSAEYCNLPWHFEPNAGQWHPQVRFVARERGFTAFLTDTEVVLRIGRDLAMKDTTGATDVAEGYRSAVLRIQLVGGSPTTHLARDRRLRFDERLPGEELARRCHAASASGAGNLIFKGDRQPRIVAWGASTLRSEREN